MRIKSPSHSEIAAHRILARTLTDAGWTANANVSVQQVLEKEEYLSPAEFDLHTRGSFDFVVFDDQPAARFALEVDGFAHAQPRQIARDLIKNDLCHRAGLPLLRIGAEHLAEPEETSILEWIISASLGVEPDEEMDDASPAGGDFALGDPGVEMEHPFPDNALLERRLHEQYALDIGRIGGEVVVLPSGARYVLDLAGWGAMKEHTGVVAAFVASERRFKVCAAKDVTRPLLEGVGRAQFAWANRLPPGRTADDLSPIEFGWDAYGVANELAAFDALRQCERWVRQL